MVAACLPATRKYYSRYVAKLGYWNILIIFLLYVLFDIWFLTTISMADKKVWWILILINLSGIIAIYRTYKEIKNIDQNKNAQFLKLDIFYLAWVVFGVGTLANLMPFFCKV